MRIAARPLALLAPCLVVLACNWACADDRRASLQVAAGDEHAAEIYSHICQGCHMANGRGAVGAGHYPALAGDLTLVSWEYVGITILRGRKGMPAFGLSADEAKQTRSVHLDDAEVADLVNYLRRHFGNHYKSKVTARDIAGLPHPDADGEREL